MGNTRGLIPSQGADVLGLIISAIVVGLIIGALGRLVLPGRQDISIWLTIAIGIIAALIGSLIASALGVGETRGIDWIKIIIQVALAAAGVALVAGRHAPGRGAYRARVRAFEFRTARSFGRSQPAGHPDDRRAADGRRNPRRYASTLDHKTGNPPVRLADTCAATPPAASAATAVREATLDFTGAEVPRTRCPAAGQRSIAGGLADDLTVVCLDWRGPAS
jgi:uncharacterized membrane protein YeaQ/YmgE (transglycosylase-associated protein family)